MAYPRYGSRAGNMRRGEVRRLLRIQVVQRNVLGKDWRAVGRDIIDKFERQIFAGVGHELHFQFHPHSTSP